MINGENIFDQSIKNNLRTYDKIQKVVTGQGDDYTTCCSLDYPYFKEHYKLVAIDLSKQQALDVDPKKMQTINFTGGLGEEATIYFNIAKAKKQLYMKKIL